MKALWFDLLEKALRESPQRRQRYRQRERQQEEVPLISLKHESVTIRGLGWESQLRLYCPLQATVKQIIKSLMMACVDLDQNIHSSNIKGFDKKYPTNFLC